MLDTVIVLGMCLALLFAVFIVGCVVIKGMIKIAKWIF